MVNLQDKLKLALKDCAVVLASGGPSPSKSIALKAHLGLARSLQGLGELDKFQALNGGVSQASELRTRVHILEERLPRIV
jgi:hypothetical protein